MVEEALKTRMIPIDQIPYQSVLGINYSGMHDSSVCIVAPDGTPVYALSLERITRIKQDGRPPYALLDKFPWDRITQIAISTNESLNLSEDNESQINVARLTRPRHHAGKHEQPFYDFINGLPCEKVFVGHQLSHASSAFWGSEFKEALCLTCDGGMYNDQWFGGVYRCSRNEGIISLDNFSIMKLAMITSLYTFVTALLGFTPNKHEGKITGLAAYGKPSDRCKILLEKWFGEDYKQLETTLNWIFSYSSTTPPQFLPDSSALQPFKNATKNIPREELAASVQAFAEQYVIKILKNIKNQGWISENICLAGGLFANVKINQCVVETGFKQLFVAPPMTDDGTALGAAWHALSSKPDFNPKPLHSMYLGPAYPKEKIQRLILEKDIKIQTPKNAATKIASLLAEEAVVAIFQGAAEFGPRALGNRSILAPATDPSINHTLNERLNRTEFMPFAPISRIEDAELLYHKINRVRHAAQFMTVTVNCTKKMKATCPATVHIDGTARPQLISHKQNPLMHEILTKYYEICGVSALVNTSFNVHEEPIVSSPEDALRGFFLSGLDYLYFEQVGLVSYKENEALAINYLKEALKNSNPKLVNIIQAKDSPIKDRAQLLQSLEEKEVVIQNQDKLLKKYDSRFRYWKYLIVPLEKLLSLCLNPSAVFTSRLGNLRQYAPRKLRLPKNYTKAKQIDLPPKISIVTPSFSQGEYLERTINSVLEQSYPNLEYFVQDGGSRDATKKILEKYAERLTGWESKADKGQAHAINLGFTKTTGEIMAWINSDDIILPGTLFYVADYFNRHPEIDVVYGNRLQIDINDKEIGQWVLPEHDDKILSWTDIIPQETLYWRRSAWERVGGKLDESFSFAMDWDFLVRLRGAGAHFARLPRFMGGFRVHPKQKTSSKIDGIGLQEMNKIRLRLLGRIPSEKEIFQAIKPYLMKQYFTDFIWRIRNILGINY